MLIWNLYKIRDKSRIASPSLTNTTYLSNVVNHYFKCNFKRLLNKCRVKYAKLLLDKGKHTPEELVKLCGFTSRSVFYSAFTKEVGMIPSRYPDKSFKIPLKYD
ncbi:helix-turn-helix domain-containing protein [Phocaeicola massiliensis]|uniref:helix-turn-helix domain-containing protein n=1 Tax=Phocaeicola massiliensis TaxID=204516 RepID=UPI003A4E4EB3